MQTECGMFRFGAFQVDRRTEELRKHGTKLRLPRQSFAVLTLLLESPGQLVSRDELREKLWPADTFVDFDHGLNAAVNRLREALGDSAEAPRFVETLPRRGYRFIAQLEVDSEQLQVSKPTESPSKVAPLPEIQSEIRLADLRKQAAQRFLAAKPILILVLLLLLLALGLLFWRWRREVTASNRLPSHADVVVTPFTSYKGQEVSPAFSPDGNQIAFAWDGGNSDNRNKFDLYVKVIGSESLLRLTDKPSMWLVPAWSPDGRTIAFIRRLDSDSGIFSVPAIGGPERKLADVPAPYSVLALSWSPDGRELVYHNYESSGRMTLRALSVETGKVREIATPDCTAAASPVFSPDGTHLAYSCGYTDPTAAIFVAPREGGHAQRVVAGDGNAASLTWSRDGRRIIFFSSYTNGLWEVSSEGGTAQPVLFAREADQPAIARQGNRLAYTYGTDNVNIWKIDLRKRSSPHLLISSTRAQRGPHLSHDGKRIVFESDRSGWENIWVSNIDGSNPVQLTDFQSLTGTPKWSRDDKTIVFDSKESGRSALYWVDPQVGLPHKISMGAREASVPSWSRDGNWIYFNSGTPEQGIYKVSQKGGSPALVSRTNGYNVQEALDGSLYFLDALVDGEIRVISNAKAQEIVLPNMPRVTYPTDWVLENKGIYFLDRTAKPATLRFFEFGSNKSRTVTTLQKEPAIWGGMAVSGDEHWFVYAQIDERVSDIMLAENFR